MLGFKGVSQAAKESAQYRSLSNQEEWEFDLNNGIEYGREEWNYLTSARLDSCQRDESQRYSRLS